ncbi:MAG: response regulator, partial [Elusimicrobiota bacterium]
LKRPKDAMILDLMLPGNTSGFDVLKRLRSFEGKVPPVIVVTAHAQTKEVQEVTTDPNVVLFLQKPINQNSLLGALHKVLKTVNPHHPD